MDAPSKDAVQVTGDCLPLRRRQLAYLARMRHDIRTPLNAIIGYGELLAEDAADRSLEELLPLLRDGVQHGRLILETVNEHLAVQRLEALDPINVTAIGTRLREAVAPVLTNLDTGLTSLAQLAGSGEAAPLSPDITRIRDASSRLHDLLEQLASHTEPMEETESTPDALPSSAGDHSAAKPNTSILVVDDDPSNRDLLRRHLVRLGYRVTLAQNGVEALRLLRDRPIDLVLLDLTMPIMDGFQVLKQMYADHHLDSVPVVVLSANDDMRSVVRCIEMGAVDHLSKPFDPVLLDTRIRSALATSHIRSEKAGSGGGTRAPRRTFEHEAVEELAAGHGMGVGGFLRSLFRRTRSYRGPMIGIAALMLVALGVEASIPLGFKFITDDALIPHNLTVLVITLAVLLIALATSTALNLTVDLFYVRFATKILNDLRFNMYRHLQRLSLGFFSRVSAGTITSRFTGDLAAVDNTVMLCLPLTLGQFVLALFSLGLLFAIEWKLALLSVFGIFVSFKAEQRIEGPASLADSRMKELQASITTEIQETIGAQPLVRIFGLQNLVIERFKHKMIQFYRTAARACFLSYLAQRVPDRSIALFGLTIIAVGATLCFLGFMTIGELIAFQILLTGLVTAISDLAWSIPQLLRAAGGMERIEEFLNERIEIVDARDAPPLARPWREIAFSDVSFAYSPDKPVLKRLNMKIPVGHHILIVGSSGSGKSTVLNLLMRFYDPASGSISIDGNDIRSVAQESLRSHMSVVLQENFLFNTSIRENIRIGKQDATDEQVEASARITGLHDIITELPGGYDMLVGERGSKLSAGQRQRIAIARAILSDPAILLLDSATDIFDAATAAALEQAIRQDGRVRTVLSITHRLDNAPSADAIFVMHEGTLAESGTHAELLARNGLYATLYRQHSASH